MACLCSAEQKREPASERARTLALAGSNWEFREISDHAKWQPAVVPGCVHLDLRRNGAIPDPFYGTNELALQWIGEREWEYRRHFVVSEKLMAEEIIELVADGLDTLATVEVNGAEVARTENMFIGYRWNVKPFLRAGSNELTIRFGNNLEYIRTHSLEHMSDKLTEPLLRTSVMRKHQSQFGWDWAPRFITAGIWRDIRLEAWSGNRLVSARIAQEHRPSKSGENEVTLSVSPEFARTPSAGARYTVAVSFADKVVAASESPAATAVSVAIPGARLWWPAGHGEQPLYGITVTANDSSGRELGRWERRIGLRTIKLDRHADQWGESFQFVINGRPIFAKGANWVPGHSFVAGLSRADYARDLRSAVAANMNMIRIWGGGIYESDDFYELCDELGLLVWQDFMSACVPTPSSEAYLENVRDEANYQIQRLRHHACLALWCGNNEIPALQSTDRLSSSEARGGYEALFHRVLPEAVTRVDGVTDYWPSSPWRSSWDDVREHADGTRLGDTHYWDVWHKRNPVKDYEKWPFRFASEFGMQSYCSPATQATFAPVGSNIFDAVMENHQKNGSGNQIILDYVSRRYRFPKGQENLIYLSQLNQAYCTEVAVEFYRRNMPRCMGALYWMLNDCWPVASWSSLEFTGRWKALHYAARRFYAPALVSADVPGDETPASGNYRSSTVHEVHLYTVYDAPEPASGLLRWDLFHLDGRVFLHGEKTVSLRYGESVRQESIDFTEAIETHGRDYLYVRIALDIGGKTVSEKTVFLSPPRFIELPKEKATVAVETLSPTRVRLKFTSPVFQHGFMFDLRGVRYACTDNYFDLYPGETRSVEIDLEEAISTEEVSSRLTMQSLVDSYR